MRSQVARKCDSGQRDSCIDCRGGPQLHESLSSAAKVSSNQKNIFICLFLQDLNGGMVELVKNRREDQIGE